MRNQYAVCISVCIRAVNIKKALKKTCKRQAMIQALIQEKGLAHCAGLVVVREKLFFLGALSGGFGSVWKHFSKFSKKVT